MPHRPDHQKERRQLAEDFGSRVGQGLRRGYKAVRNLPITGFPLRAAENLGRDFRRAGGGAAGVGAAVGGDIRRFGADIADTEVPGARALRRARQGFSAGFAGTPESAQQTGSAASEQVAPRTTIRRGQYNILPGENPNRVEITDSRNNPELGFGTVEAPGIRERLSNSRGTYTEMPAEDFVRSGYDASAVSGARQAALERGDLGAVRRSLMSPEERAAADEEQRRQGLRRIAMGNGRGLNQSFSSAFTDAQRRKTAQRELDRLHDLDRDTIEAEGRLGAAGIRRQTEQEKQAREDRIRMEDQALKTIDERYAGPNGTVTDPDAKALEVANLEAQLSGDPAAPYRLNTPTGIAARLGAKRKLVEAANADRADSWWRRFVENVFPGGKTEMDTWVSHPSFGGIELDGDEIVFRGAGTGRREPRISLDELKKRVSPSVYSALINAVRIDNQQP